MNKLKDFYQHYIHTPIGLSLILSFILNLVIESLGRQSLGNGLQFLLESPLVFLYNTLVIFAFLSVGMLFRRRVFVYLIIGAFWLAIGIINGVILSNRMTPFTVKDLSVLEDGMSIVTNYLSAGEILMAGVGALILLGGIVLLFLYAPKKKGSINHKKNAAIFLAILLGTLGITNLAIRTKVVDTYFGNLNYAYRDYGVPYCFLSTWLNTGIAMPQGYSEERILAILPQEEEAASDTDVNILFLQLESFMDPLEFKQLTYSQDPTPFFRQLKSQYSAGYLTVPSVGAGTANTEFEVNSGMSVKFFGPGEYPYKSVLTEKTCETIPYNLKDLGYSTHAIHNHRAVFYGRNQVFRNLGFDTFTSLEYMLYPTKTPKNWAKDGPLTGEILSALQSTEGRDYIYTISVQGHGKYPEEEVLKNPAVRVTGDVPETLRLQYEYYVNQIAEMDLFLQDLTEQLAGYDEKVVLVLYGDHLPALDMTSEELNSGDLFKTEYVIWSNFPMKKSDQNLTSFQLGAEVLDRLGIHTGNITRFHQLKMGSPGYRQELEMLEYDILYGKQYLYGGQSPFLPTDLKMGVRDIVIQDIVEIGGKYYLKGENFTQYSKVTLRGELLNTVYLGPTVLGLEDKADPEDIPEMKVSQVEKNNEEILSTTE